MAVFLALQSDTNTEYLVGTRLRALRVLLSPHEKKDLRTRIWKEKRMPVDCSPTSQGAHRGTTGIWTPLTFADLGNMQQLAISKGHKKIRRFKNFFRELSRVKWNKKLGTEPATWCVGPSAERKRRDPYSKSRKKCQERHWKNVKLFLPLHSLSLDFPCCFFICFLMLI